MKKNLYCTRDDCAEVFMPPFLSINESTAKRDFIDGVSEHKNRLDLTLYFIGVHDDSSGSIEPAIPQRIMSGTEIKLENTGE